LTEEERIYFLENIWIPNQQTGEFTEEILASRYGLAKSSVRRWAEQYSSNKTINTTMGRPPLLDNNGIKNCSGEVIEAQNNDKPLDDCEIIRDLTY
jgi:hypothetical protein